MFASCGLRRAGVKDCKTPERQYLRAAKLISSSRCVTETTAFSLGSVRRCPDLETCSQFDSTLWLRVRVPQNLIKRLATILPRRSSSLSIYNASPLRQPVMLHSGRASTASKTHKPCKVLFESNQLPSNFTASRKTDQRLTEGLSFPAHISQLC